MNTYDPANDLVYVHLAPQPPASQIDVGPPASPSSPSDATPASGAESPPARGRGELPGGSGGARCRRRVPGDPRVRSQDPEVAESDGLLSEADDLEELGADPSVHSCTTFGDSEQLGHVPPFRVSDGARRAG